MKTYNVITIFPEMIDAIFSYGVIYQGIKKNLIKINPVNLRDFTKDKHKTVDDYQYGGGQGLLLKPEPICDAVKSIKTNDKNTHVILLDPRGKKYTQSVAQKLLEYDSVTFICGRYEGVDERVRKLVVDEEISLGDFILTGGELAASVIIDSVARLIPGVLGDEMSFHEESFSDGLLEYPHYTRPYEYEGLRVPDVLVNGNHKEINEWRYKESLKITLQNRPDLLKHKALEVESSKFVSQIVERFEKGVSLYVALLHYPMVDKHGDIVATSITNMDLHDISRSCRTFGVKNYFVVNPLEAQREIARRVLTHWQEGYGATYNPNRKEAFEYTIIKESLSEVIEFIENKEGCRPVLVATSAKDAPNRAKLEPFLKENFDKPILLLFGTGWGMSEDLMKLVDVTIEPIKGAGSFNHLSVRSAVAIYLNKINGLLGGNKDEQQAN
ncbi:tRNA (guanosine(37)-N1)-methyltransferase TrmD [Deferribacteraceae bacterium V6Fe1]|nr:tRNA (guanosine(37)-N1)-methyltransferase TrmD [Deferribacteraceae bacterium V6Fe1]